MCLTLFSLSWRGFICFKTLHNTCEDLNCRVKVLNSEKKVDCRVVFLWNWSTGFSINRCHVRLVGFCVFLDSFRPEWDSQTAYVCMYEQPMAGILFMRSDPSGHILEQSSGTKRHPESSRRAAGTDGNTNQLLLTHSVMYSCLGSAVQCCYWEGAHLFSGMMFKQRD